MKNVVRTYLIIDRECYLTAMRNDNVVDKDCNYLYGIIANTSDPFYKRMVYDQIIMALPSYIIKTYGNYV